MSQSLTIASRKKLQYCKLFCNDNASSMQLFSVLVRSSDVHCIVALKA